MPRARRRSSNVTTTYPECDACGQRIAFVTMSDTGKRLPVDPYPVADGNVCARQIGAKLHGYVVAENRPAQPSWRRYAAHFGTCPNRPRPGQVRAVKAEPTPTLPGLS